MDAPSARSPVVKALALLLCAWLAQGARAEELPQSQACKAALDAFNQAEADMAGSAASSATQSDRDRQRSASERLYPFRKRVADACLGGLTTSPPPSQHTLAVPVSPLRPSTVQPPVRSPALPPVAITVPRPAGPVLVTQCNAVSCVASDGSTLTRVGPNLMGPKGLCAVQGGVLRCP